MEPGPGAEGHGSARLVAHPGLCRGVSAEVPGRVAPDGHHLPGGCHELHLLLQQQPGSV